MFFKGERERKMGEKKTQPSSYHHDMTYMCYPSGCASTLSFKRDDD
jgi:hypothetical protein